MQAAMPRLMATVQCSETHCREANWYQSACQDSLYGHDWRPLDAVKRSLTPRRMSYASVAIWSGRWPIGGGGRHCSILSCMSWEWNGTNNEKKGHWRPKCEAIQDRVTSTCSRALASTGVDRSRRSFHGRVNFSCFARSWPRPALGLSDYRHKRPPVYIRTDQA